MMMALDLFTSTRESYRQDEKEKMAKKKEKGVNPYDAMKGQMRL